MSAQPDPIQLAMHKELIEEVKRLRSAMSNGQAPVDNVLRPKGDGNSSMVNTPYQQVMIVDERGDRRKFIDLIEEMASIQKKQSLEDPKTAGRNLKVFEDLRRLAHDRNNLNREIRTEQKVGRQKEIEDLVTSLQTKQEKRGIFQRIFDISKKEGVVSGLLTGLPRALAGSITDKLKSGLRETVGAPLQVLGLVQGDLYNKFNKDFADRDKMKLSISKKQQEEQLRELHDYLLSTGKNEEEIILALTKFTQAQEKRVNSEFSRETRSGLSRNEVGMQGLADSLTKSMKSTFTADEQESHERNQSLALSNIRGESEKQNEMFRMLSDPRSSMALGVRIIDSMVPLIEMTAGKNKPVDEGGGILSWLFTGFKALFGRLGGLVTSLATGVTGLLSSIGAGLGGGAVTGAVGLAGATAALGVSLYTLNDSYQTTLELNARDQESIKKRSKIAEMNTQRLTGLADKLGTSISDLRSNTSVGFDQTSESGLKGSGGKLLSSDILEAKRRESLLQRASIETQIGELERRQDEYLNQGVFGRAGSFMVGQRFGGDDQELLTELRLQRNNVTGSIAAFEVALEKRNQSIDKIIENKMPKLNAATQQDEVVKELRNLGKMLEKSFGAAITEGENAKNIAAAGLASAEASRGPMVMPSTVYSAPPRDSASTQSVIKS